MTTFMRQDLLDTLNECRPGLAAVGLVPELSHLWFDSKNVYAYDGGLGLRRKMESDLDCGVPGRVLLDLLKTSTLKQVTIDQTKEGVVVQMGKAKVNLTSIDSERRVWPFPKVLPKKDGLVLNEQILLAFKELQFVKMSRGTMAVHHGIVMDVGHDEVTLLSTDTRSIAQRIVKAKNVTMPQFVVPWALVSNIVSLFDGEGDFPKLWVHDDCIVAGVPGTMVASNLLELPASPNLPKVMADRAEGKLKALPKGLQPLLERAVILAGTEEAHVNVSTSKGSLRLSGKWPMGTMDERLELEDKVESVSVKLAADGIVRALGKVDSWRLTEKELVMSGDKGAFRYLLSTKDKKKKE